MPTRRHVLATAAAAALLPRATRAGDDDRARAVLMGWYRLVLELVRHTPTYSPPVAARAFAWLGLTAHEALVSAGAGQGGSLSPRTNLPATLPPPDACDPAATLHAALAQAVPDHFGNTGPTGQRAMAAMADRLGARATAGLDPDAAARAASLGRAVATAVFAASQDDGGAVVDNLGFPPVWQGADAPGSWKPTSTIGLQQAPLLPAWGQNRLFVLASGADCGLPPPPAFSTDPGSPFHAEALEVHQVSQTLTEEQKIIARFWSDDPMLSPTPPGHWVTIVLDISDRDGLPAARTAHALAILGIAVSDGFIACWDAKYRFDLLRPVTYIRAHIDPAWQPLLITPPFPEYPSGHSTQSGAAAAVLAALFGDPFPFDDATHEDDGLPVRSFASFTDAAREAAISRLYGGIHFRAAIDQGLAQGDCVGRAVIARLMA
ncbi:MAG: phosphatase PAP2 family protein [Rhodobacteraceae bacterium]|jgi:hypothetical protein|nr:phosphatase PAP2 family protein [Paracoccaceae bacterium]